MSRVWTALLVVVVCFAFSAGAAAQRGGGDPKARAVKNPVPSTPASINAGRAVYNMNCRQCHGLRLKGDGPLAPKNPKPADLTDDKWDRGSSDGELFVVLRDGAGPKFDMKGYKSKMSETDMWNVVNFLRSLQAK